MNQRPEIKLTTYSIYYMRPEFFSTGIWGSQHLGQRNKLPDAGNLLATHIFLREIEAETPAHAFHLMQAENWSPNGEAADLIQARGLEHTSMCVGDVIVDQHTFEAFLVDRYGMFKLTAFELPAIGPNVDAR